MYSKLVTDDQQLLKYCSKTHL